MSGNDVLIVIPCLNEEQHLPRLLDQFTRENPDALIVVADGGSTDRSRAIVADQTVRGNVILLDNPRRLQSAGINGAVVAHGAGKTWLVRIDAHCEYPADFVGTLQRAAEREAAESVVVSMVTRGRSCFQVAAAAAQNSVLGTGGSLHRHVGTGRFVDHGHHALMRIDLFTRVGGYREDMAANEDAELDLRLAQTGARIWLEPGAAITYFPRKTPAQLCRQYFKYGAGRATTVKLHHARLKLRQLAPVFITLAVALVFLTPFSRWLALPAAMWLLLTLCVGAVIGSKEKGVCALFTGAAAAIMHLAWGTGFLSAVFRPRPRG